MCFNVFSHNRDDHSKNFSFLYDEKNQKWKLSPAYDMTYSSSIGGEHATCVDGNGKNPELKEILNVGLAANISEATARNIALEIRAVVNECLSVYINK
jgi:serine/threonine-protein kinase HipA